MSRGRNTDTTKSGTFTIWLNLRSTVYPLGNAHYRERQKPAGSGHLRAGEVVVSLKCWELGCAPFRLSFQGVEANVQRAVRLHRRAAALDVALGVVDVPGGEQHTFGEHGPPPHPGCQLADVQVSAILPGGHGPQTRGRDGFADGTAPLGSGPSPAPPRWSRLRSMLGRSAAVVGVTPPSRMFRLCMTTSSPALLQPRAGCRDVSGCAPWRGRPPHRLP